MKRFISLIVQDFVIMTRNWIFWTLPILAVTIILVINFAIPEDVSMQSKEIMFYEENGNMLREYLKAEGEEDHLVNSKEELVEAVKEDSNRIGLVIGGIDDGKLQFTAVLQGTESEVIKKLLEATMEHVIKELGNIETSKEYDIVSVRPKSDPVPFNLNQAPFLIFMEAGFLGMFIIMMLIFQEKQEGSIRAFRVTTAGTMRYILAKVLLITVFSAIYAVVMCLFIFGTSINYLLFVLMTVLGSFVMTMIALITCVYFNSLSDYLFVFMGIFVVVSLPVMSYFMPSFSPAVIRIIPTYPIMFGYREIFFPTGNTAMLGNTFLTLGIEGIVLFVLACFSVKAKLMKEGR